MLRFTSSLFKLRPREVGFTPPKLIRRPGTFDCKLCHHRWTSTNVWVTEYTRKVYQGETCVKCGSTNKPTSVGTLDRDVFRNTPRDRKPDMARYQHGLERRRKR